jgi:hypothetical protein
MFIDVTTNSKETDNIYCQFHHTNKQNISITKHRSDVGAQK